MSMTDKRETDSKVDETEAQNFVLLLQKCREVSAYPIFFFLRVFFFELAYKCMHDKLRIVR